MATEVTISPDLGHGVLFTQGGVGATPGYDAIDLRRILDAAKGWQEGVYGKLADGFTSGSAWKVTEDSDGASMTVEVAADENIARVDGDSVTAQGPYIVAPHNDVIELDVPTADTTNPRIDLVVLRVYDNTHDALGENYARVEYLTGTPSSGATLTNLTGAPSIPDNALALAYVEVTANDTTISNANILDVRTHAEGFRWGGSFAALSSGTDPSTTSANAKVGGDGVTRVTARLSGDRPVAVSVTAHAAVTATTITAWRLFLDGSTVDVLSQNLGASQFTVMSLRHIINASQVTRGPHTIELGFGTAAGTLTLYCNSNNHLHYEIEELGP